MPLIVVPDNEEDRRIEELLHAIDHDLTPQAGRILRMRYGEGQSYREIAEALGISVSTVNKHVVQALRELRAKFSAPAAVATTTTRPYNE